jgi:hypothetical protein
LIRPSLAISSRLLVAAIAAALVASERREMGRATP